MSCLCGCGKNSQLETEPAGEAANHSQINSCGSENCGCNSGNSSGHERARSRHHGGQMFRQADGQLNLAVRGTQK